ncbi:MAG: hypothetical protein AAF664_09400 [Planctomycetota bacterium]
MSSLADHPASIEALLNELAKMSPRQREIRLQDQSTDQRQILLDSVELRKKTLSKLPPSERWYLVTRRSLQQATAWQVAHWKASRFPLGQTLTDVCSGIGGDAITLAKAHEVQCIERDTIVLECLRWNLSTHLSREVSIETRDFDASCVTPGGYLHIDPDRRALANGKETRTINVDRFSPSLTQILPAIERSQGSIVKLAPGTHVDVSMRDGIHAWISLAGEVREHAWMVGQLRHSFNESRAAVMLNREAEAISFCADMIEETDTIDTPCRFLIDPDAAIRASGLTVAFASHHHLKVLHSPAGFLTADEIPADVLNMSIIGEVVWQGSADLRRLKRELRLRHAHVESIKDRTGIPDAARRLKLPSKKQEIPLTLWLARKTNSHGIYAALTKSVAAFGS